MFENKIKKLLPASLQGFLRRADAYLVGGCVRDVLIGRRPVDYDMAVASDAKGFARALSRKLGARAVVLGRPEQPLYRILYKETPVDVSPLMGSCIEEDMQRRDFSINAMAWSWSAEQLIDGVGGLEDLEHKTLRMVSAKALKADPVRLLRAYRIAAELKFSICPQTRDSIRRQASMIEQAAGERIRTELVRLLRTPHSFELLRQMGRDHLLNALFWQPEPWEKNDRIAVINFLEQLFAGPAAYLPSIDDLLPAFPDPKQCALLKIAVLGRNSRPDAVKTILKRLRFSNQEQESVCRFLRNGRYLADSYRESRHALSSRDHWAKFFVNTGPQAPYLLVHFLAEAMAGHRRKSVAMDAGARQRFFHKIWDLYHRTYAPRLTQPPLISGRDLMDHLKMESSPAIGALLAKLKVAQIAGRITTRQAAFQKAAQYLREMQSSTGRRR